MIQFGGKNAKKSFSDSKRHFTVVMDGKEHGLYISSTPSSSAKKAVTKLCSANKSKKVEFHIREITQGSKKKTYGPYNGYIEKLKEPIELKGRIIRYKPFAKLSEKTGKKMKGGLTPNGEYTFNDLNGNYSYISEKQEIEKIEKEIQELIEKRKKPGNRYYSNVKQDREIRHKLRNLDNKIIKLQEKLNSQEEIYTLAEKREKIQRNLQLIKFLEDVNN